jgi:hypothetical protein
MKKMIPYVIAPLGPLVISVASISTSLLDAGMVYVLVSASYLFTIPSCICIRFVEKISKKESNALFILYGCLLGIMEGLICALLIGYGGFFRFGSQFGLMAMSATILFTLVRSFQNKQDESVKWAYGLRPTLLSNVRSVQKTMMYTAKILVASIALSVLGIFLIWNGITGNVVKTIDREDLIPKWMYVLGGIIVLIFPATWIIIRINN